MKKIDFKKELKHLYQPSTRKIETVVIPKMNFLMIDGKGDPNTSQDFKKAIEMLFAISYNLKFMAKKSNLKIDYVVMPLEGLWWVKDNEKFTLDDKNNWHWTAMIMQPEFITKEMVNKACIDVAHKKHLPTELIRFESFHEGHAAQILYIGPYSEEEETVKSLHHFIKNSGYKLSGKHHEIYLSDFRKIDPKKLKTIIRQPFL